MKHKKRSIIITVDHRAREMNKSYNINYTERKEIDKLSQTINSEFTTSINLNYENINKWMEQFI